jgi:hypothetical protein
MTRKQQLESVLLYLSKHGRHIDSIRLMGDGKHRFSLLGSCHVFGSAATERFALLEALSMLPAGLEHLSLRDLRCNGQMVQFPTAVLQQLQQLTYLELADVSVLGPDEASPVMQPLQALTRLQDLRLRGVHTDQEGGRVTSDMLSGTPCLTRLEVSTACGPQFRDEVKWAVEPGVLTGKAQLEHLRLSSCNIAGGAIGLAQLLCELQELQQMTYLNFTCSLADASTMIPVDTDEPGTPPAASYAALTASSKLQHLNISGCTLPEGVWQHLFPAGRQLLHLQVLDMSYVGHAHGICAEAPACSSLVRCCPGLQTLGMERLRYSEELLGSLQGLTGLCTLDVAPSLSQTVPVDFADVCQLSGLKHLKLSLPKTETEPLLLQLTQLKQLGFLLYSGPTDGVTPEDEMVFLFQVGWDTIWLCFLCSPSHVGCPKNAG